MELETFIRETIIYDFKTDQIPLNNCLTYLLSKTGFRSFPVILEAPGRGTKAKGYMNVELGEVNMQGRVDDSDPYGRIQEGVAEEV